MPHYLADVIMPEPPPVQEEEEIIPEGLPAAPSEETIQYDEEEEEEEHAEQQREEEIIPEPVVKTKLTQKQVFTPLKVLPIKPEVEEDLPPPIHVPIEKPVKKTRAKRGPATPEQLDRLRIGREKAASNRRKKAEANKAEKDEDNLLKEKVKVVRRRKLIKEIEEDPGEIESQKKSAAYSQDQLDEAVSKAVAKTEFLRKQRKEAKKKAEEKASHDAQVFKSINSALKPSGWDQCFN